MLAYPQPLRDLRNRVTPLGDLRDRIALEIVTEIASPHHGLLASKLGKKASTNLGAIHSSPKTCALPVHGAQLDIEMPSRVNRLSEAIGGSESLFLLRRLRARIERQQFADPREGLETRRLVWSLTQEDNLGEEARILDETLSEFERALVTQANQHSLETKRAACLEAIGILTRRLLI